MGWIKLDQIPMSPEISKLKKNLAEMALSSTPFKPGFYYDQEDPYKELKELTKMTNLVNVVNSDNKANKGTTNG